MLRVSRTERPSMSDTRTTAAAGDSGDGHQVAIHGDSEDRHRGSNRKSSWSFFFTNVAVSVVSFAPIITVRLADVSPSLHLLNAARFRGRGNRPTDAVVIRSAASVTSPIAGIVHGERELVRDNGERVAVSAVSFAPIVTVRLADVSPSLHFAERVTRFVSRGNLDTP